VSSSSVHGSQRRIGLTFALAAWAFLIGLLVLFSDRFFDGQVNPNSQAQAARNGQNQLEIHLKANAAHHYVVPGYINGQAVTFLVDTGATVLAVDEALAENLGLKKGAPKPLLTANGTVMGWRTLVRSVNVAGLQEHAIPAVILPDLGSQVLLGMSFLKRVEMLQRDGVLILRQQG
jgi:aspartyl protease family protein